MAKALVVSTKFTAIDKFSQTMRKITNATSKFATKTQVAMAKVQRAERKVRAGFSKMLGKLGQLGLAFGALSVAMLVGGANIELEENLASLSAITGVTGEAFKAFEKQIDIVSKKQSVFAGDTAKAFEVVGSAKPELLGNAEALGMVTDAVITLSKASKDDLTLSAQNLTGAMNQFNLSADQSIRTINVLAAGSQAGAANITEINESLKGFGAVADGANITLEQSVGLIETLATKSLKGAEAGTALRGTILRLQAAGLGYASGVFNINDALEEARKQSNSFSTALERDAYMQKVFGQRNITTGQILLENIDKFNGFTKAVTGTNVAIDQANINSSTLKMRWKEVVDAFKNATTSTDLQSESMQKLKDILAFVATNMNKIIAGIMTAVKIFAIYKGVMIALNTVMAIQNAIMLANPITWIILGVVALTAGIIALVANWENLVNWIKTSDNWFAKITRGTINALVNAFKAVGKAISWVVDLFKKVWEWIKKIASGAFAPIQKIMSLFNGKTSELDVNMNQGQQALNPDATVEQVRTERIEKTSNEKMRLQVEAANGTKATILEDPNSMIQLTPTLGWQ